MTYLYNTTTFPHQPLKSISKVTFLHRFHCKRLAKTFGWRTFLFFFFFFFLFVVVVVMILSVFTYLNKIARHQLFGNRPVRIVMVEESTRHKWVKGRFFEDMFSQDTSWLATFVTLPSPICFIVKFPFVSTPFKVCGCRLLLRTVLLLKLQWSSLIMRVKDRYVRKVVSSVVSCVFKIYSLIHSSKYDIWNQNYYNRYLSHSLWKHAYSNI